ncbi:hypothetical protein ARMSODRAFT_961779 [Armillaria solidipes]|uniref:Uncharacterized protein n=1 Tax=Armillaria solidipes TaxID=1076256 RepID=A0A2H3B126_9AGAR|nr:hypothetical protein ARMSODRAFT_961779 [Armillaria solidipes]
MHHAEFLVPPLWHSYYVQNPFMLTGCISETVERMVDAVARTSKGITVTLSIGYYLLSTRDCDDVLIR